MQRGSTELRETSSDLQSVRASSEQTNAQLKQSEARLQDTQRALTEEQKRAETLQSELQKLREERDNQQQTVALLVSEKASLSEEVGRLEGLEAGTFFTLLDHPFMKLTFRQRRRH